MSERARRRRAPPPVVKVKQAFGSDDEDTGSDKRNPADLSDEYVTALPHTNHDANGDHTYERAFFAVQNKTVEVIFENNILKWADVTGEPIGDDTYRRTSAHRDDQSSVSLDAVFGISPIHAHGNWSLNINENIAGTTISTSNSISAPVNSSSTSVLKNVPLRGFQLHSYQSLPDNILQEILIVFQSDDPGLIERWYHFLSKIILEMTPSLHVFVICNPYAGARQTRHLYNSKIRPMLETRHCKITYMEIDNQVSADEVLENFEENLDTVDSLVVIGGDGSVINVINALIRYGSKANRVRLDTRTDLPPIPFPICIVPDGTTNIISHTIHGNIDHCTPILHLIYNRQMKIDMSAIFDAEYKFVTANFGAGAGYPANVLKYFPRYSLHSPRTVVKKSFAKAASKKNLQPIELEIRYIAAPQTDSRISRCYRGCPSCTPAEIEKSDDQVKAFDDAHVQEITRRRKSLSTNHDNNPRISSASRRSFNPPNDEEKNWKVLNHHYLQVAVFTNAQLWSMAPQGLSKFGHLADGLLDLVLVESVNRKEFLRYVKRNGNSKNQHELPFTNTFKVKEIEIELKFIADDDNDEIRYADNQYDSTPSDNSSDENMSDNENKPAATERYQPHPPSVPIPENPRRLRRQHLQINKQAQESIVPLQSSLSVDGATSRTRNRLSQHQSESEIDSPPVDQYNPTITRRRSGIFQSLKLKKNKIPLPRPSSARKEEGDDERHQEKTRKSTGGTLRPARSLLSLFAAGNLPSGKSEKPSGRLSSAASARKMSAMSRSSSMDNPQTANTNDRSRRKKGRCLWNLDFTPYNSPLIRIKCFCRYLTVYGVGLDPETRIRELNYSCF